MEATKKKGKVLIPSAMMAVVGMLMGAAVGPAPLTGAILGADEGSKGTPLMSGLSGSVDAPPTALEGQAFKVSLTVTADPSTGAAVDVFPYDPSANGAPCEVTRFEIVGGVALGGPSYVILPETGLGLEIIPEAFIRLSWTAEAAGIGSCKFGAKLVNPLSLDAPIDVWDTVGIIPDISTITIDLGHLKTVGGQITVDTAKTIAPPAASEVTIQTISPRVLAMISATISHDDGVSWRDTGRFSISPSVDLGLFDAANLGIPAVWQMTLTDDGDAIKPWLAIGEFPASEQGTLSQACLRGDYYDNSDKKGGKSHCVNVKAYQTAAASFENLDPLAQQVVKELVARTGHAFVPTGVPNVFYYFDDAGVEAT